MRQAWRISNYADLRGLGGRRGTGRWHRYAPIVYCAEHPANAMLETLVHLEIGSPDELPLQFQLLEIEIPDDLAIERIPAGALAEQWRDDERISQALGMAWLQRGETPLLRVPGAVMPAEFNVLINPQHADASRIDVVAAHRYPYDRRLFRP